MECFTLRPAIYKNSSCVFRSVTSEGCKINVFFSYILFLCVEYAWSLSVYLSLSERRTLWTMVITRASRVHSGQVMHPIAQIKRSIQTSSTDIFLTGAVVKKSFQHRVQSHLKPWPTHACTPCSLPRQHVRLDDAVNVALHFIHQHLDSLASFFHNFFLNCVLLAPFLSS